jgi:hypothetical protein
MIPGVIVLLLAPLLWAIAWFGVLYGSRLPKKSWKRLPVAILSLSGLWGIMFLQLNLLSAIGSAAFVRKMFIYITTLDWLPAIVFILVAAIREDRAKKRRGASSPQPAVDASADVASGKQ